MMLKGGFNRHAMQKKYSPSGGGDIEEENDEDDEDEDEAGPSGGDDAEEYNEDKDEQESGEFDSHILQMSLLSTSDYQPLNPCKRISSSPQKSPISICRVLQGQKAIN
jgi:hypothetical protein